MDEATYLWYTYLAIYSPKKSLHYFTLSVNFFDAQPMFLVSETILYDTIMTDL